MNILIILVHYTFSRSSSNLTHIHMNNLLILLCWLRGSLIESRSFYLRSWSISWHVSVVRKSTSKLTLISNILWTNRGLITFVLWILLLWLIYNLHIFIVIIVLFFTLLTCRKVTHYHIICIQVLCS